MATQVKAMSLPPASTEQKTIINSFAMGKNVLVDSVAGSGKTTTNLHIAVELKKKRILLLTYNAKLRLETKERVDRMGITNLEVHTYHSFCVNYLDRRCHTDLNMSKYALNVTRPSRALKFDIIICDEAQDITHLYYGVICKLVHLNSVKNFQFGVFGDKFQSIYRYNQADSRFIVKAEKLFNFSDRKWAMCHLSQTFRVRKPACDFINNCVLKYERLIPFKKNGERPRYIITNHFKPGNILEEIQYYIGN